MKPFILAIKPKVKILNKMITTLMKQIFLMRPVKVFGLLYLTMLESKE
jgi:hypothetical protein